MGPCCSKPKRDSENLPALSLRFSGDQKGKSDFIIDSADETYGSRSVGTPEEMRKRKMKNTHKTEAELIQSKKDDFEKDISYNYKLGIFFDIKIGMWFRLIFVMDDDSLRKQFMSFYDLNVQNMTEDEFIDWCEVRGYPETKKFYELFKRMECFPFNRLLSALSHKYDVKFHISDVFIFKGKGPYRAITCCAQHHISIDKALNEYELRTQKQGRLSYLNKHWDNMRFPDPTVDIRDTSEDFPFPWPRRIRPIVEKLPQWPFNYSKSSPFIFKKLMGDIRVTYSTKTDIQKSYGLYGNRNLTSSRAQIIQNEPEKLTDGKSIATNSNHSILETTPSDVKSFFEGNA